MQRLRKMATAVAATVVAAGLGVTVAASPAAAATPVLGFGHFVLAGFGANAGSWHTDKHPRFVVDITGDHRADIVGFGDAGVYTSIATGGGGFTSPSFVIGDFGFNQGWRATYEPPVVPTPRFVTDITGDGRADIVGVGNAGIYTAVSNGNGTFGPMTFQPGSFAAGSCFGGAWATDINGDGRNDIVAGAGHDYGVFWFEQGEGGKWTRRTIDTAWSQAHASTLVDLNGDGQPELVTGKRFMAHNGSDPGEREPLGVYWFEFKKGSGPGGVEWIRHIIDFGGRMGGGMQIPVVDIDGDGDLDVICAGKSGLFIAENLTKSPRRS
jgi:hypothetical protein